MKEYRHSKPVRKFRKKPVVIAAYLWDGDDDAVFEWANTVSPDSPTGLSYARKPPELRISTLEGAMTVELGDWIVCGVKGEFYPVKPDIFAETYDEVSGEA